MEWLPKAREVEILEIIQYFASDGRQARYSSKGIGGNCFTGTFLLVLKLMRAME